MGVAGLLVYTKGEGAMITITALTGPYAGRVREVSCILDPMTLVVMEECTSHGYLEEFVPAGDGGFHVVHHDVELFEAVVLSQDIIREVSCW